MSRRIIIVLAVFLGVSVVGNLALGIRLISTPNKVERPAASDSVRLVVAAANIQAQQEIADADIKTIEVKPDVYQKLTKSRRHELYGAQPVGRIAKVPIFAEQPIFDENCHPFDFDPSVATLLARGKRGVVVEVPTKEACAVVGEYVNLLCTMKETTGPAATGPSRTTVIAHGLLVLAPAYVIHSGPQPPPAETRSYTLQASPYRHLLIELARRRGCIFTLSVIAKETEEDIPKSDDDPNTELVTEADLDTIFGLKGQPMISPDKKP